MWLGGGCAGDAGSALNDVSQRCNRAPEGGYGTTVPTDNGGRVIESECRDCNPGSWHVLVANLMGIRKQGLVIDQTVSDEVVSVTAEMIE